MVVPSQISAGPDGAAEIARGLVDSLRAIVRSVEAIPVSAYEEREPHEVVTLLHDARAVVGSAVELVVAVLGHYDALAEQRASVRNLRVAPVAGSALCGDLERALEEDAGVRRIQNLAFIARMGLRDRASALASLTDEAGKWELIDAASSCLREVMKALGALDLAICAFQGFPEPSTFYVTELERSLTIRRAYRIFYADVAPAREPTPAEVTQRLRRAASAVAKLAGRPIYTSMRVHDRFMLRGVQRRMQAWLSMQEEDARAHLAAGVRLFQDVAHLAELMLAVNDRAELREHDGKVVVAAAAMLGAPDADVAAVIALLRSVQGRDAELDALLASAVAPTREALLARVVHVRGQLAPRSPSAPASRPSAGALDDEDFF